MLMAAVSGIEIKTHLTENVCSVHPLSEAFKILPRLDLLNAYYTTNLQNPFHKSILSYSSKPRVDRQKAKCHSKEKKMRGT